MNRVMNNVTATATVNEEITRLSTAALDALKRDFAVFAVEPEDKHPLTRYAPHGFKSATKNTDKVCKPYLDGYAANIGIACGESNLAVLDIDDEFSCLEDFQSWMKANLPETFTVHTGRRIGKVGGKRAGLPVYGVHLYYRNAIPDGFVTIDGIECQIKSLGGYVIGSDSVHPDSGERYEIIKDIPITPLPEIVKQGVSKPKDKPSGASGIVVSSNTLIPPSHRNDWVTGLMGTLRNKHFSETAAFETAKAAIIHQCEDGENYFIQEEHKIRDLARRSQTWDAPEITIPNVPIPEGYCMTAEEWAAHDFSKEESESLIGTATNAIVRPLTKNLVLAPEKAFKTTFLMRLMAGLAAGVTIYDELPVRKPCKIVYFHAELNPAELQQRIAASVVDVDTQGRFIHNRDIRTHLINETGRQFIAETVQQYKPDVVVFDPWQDLITGFDENSSKDTGIARAFMTSLIDTYKVTIFLVQHEGKDGSKGGRGHSSLAGWRDTLIKLTRKEGSNQVRISVSPRWGEPVTLELTLNNQTLTSSTAVGFTSQQSELRTLLKEYPAGATTQQIADGLTKTLDAAYKMIQRAIKDGAVIKNDAGLICLVTKETETKGEGQ